MKKYEVKITRGDVDTVLRVMANDKEEAGKRVFEILGERGLKIKELWESQITLSFLFEELRAPHPGYNESNLV